MTGELKGKVVLITGGSSGIGEATAIAFGSAGAKVIIASRRSMEGEEVARRIQNQGGEAMFVKTDVSVEAEVKALIDTIAEKYGRLDCAFNNAGVGKTCSLIEGSEEDWNYIINVNLKGTWLCLKHEIAVMLEKGNGAIVNMASVGGIIGTNGLSIYSASKGGVIALTKAAAIEYAQKDIRINVISSGTIHTHLADTFPQDLLNSILKKHPIGRMGKPEEIADAVLWLCSDKASFITGHNLIIDGGYTAQ